MATLKLKIARPDTHTYGFHLPDLRLAHDLSRNKAVAEGAISWYLDRFVTGRIVKHTYGTPSTVEFNPSDPEHCERSDMKYSMITGRVVLDIFTPILLSVSGWYGHLRCIPGT